MKRSTTADAPPSLQAEMSGAATVLPGVPLPASDGWTPDVVPAAPVSAPQAMLAELAVPDLHRLPAPAGYPLAAPPAAHPSHRLEAPKKGSRRDKQPKPPRAGKQPKPPKAGKQPKPPKAGTAVTVPAPTKSQKPAAEGSRRRLMMLIAVAVVAAGAVAYYLMVLLPSMSEV